MFGYIGPLEAAKYCEVYVVIGQKMRNDEVFRLEITREVRSKITSVWCTLYADF